MISTQPIRSKLRINIPDGEEIRKIDETALALLEEVGVAIPSEKALKVFADARADSGLEKKIVRIPSQMTARKGARLGCQSSCLRPKPAQNVAPTASTTKP